MSTVSTVYEVVVRRGFAFLIFAGPRLSRPGQGLPLRLTAALNPTLLTATTVMLLLPSPKRLLLGYWLGAMTTGVTVGLAIVHWLSGSGTVRHDEAHGRPGARHRARGAGAAGCAGRRHRPRRQRAKGRARRRCRAGSGSSAGARRGRPSSSASSSASPARPTSLRSPRSTASSSVGGDRPHGARRQPGHARAARAAADRLRGRARVDSGQGRAVQGLARPERPPRTRDRSGGHRRGVDPARRR